MALTSGADFSPAPSLLSGAPMNDSIPDAVVTQSDPVAVQAPPAYSVPATPAPVVDTRSGTQKLLAGILSGLAGGASAPTDSTMGGALGLQNQQRQEAQVQQNIANQNQQAQQTFENQAQQQQIARANQAQLNSDSLSAAQTHLANLNALEAAHRVAFLPLDDQRAYAQGQEALFNAYKATNRTPFLIPDNTGAVNDFIKQHPEAANWEVVHLHNPSGGDGQVAFIQPPQPGQKPLSAEAKAAAFKRVGAPLTAADAANMSDADFYKAVQAYGLESVKQAGENHRTAVTQAGEDRRAAASRAAAAGTTTEGPALDAEIQSLHQGKAIPTSFIGGRGSAKQIKSLTDAWINKHPEDADKVQKFQAQAKEADKVPVISALQTGRTLFAQNGTIDQIEGLVNTIPRSEMPALNKWIQTGSYQGGNTQIAAVLSSLPDISQELATFNSGATGRSSDKRIDLAEQQLRKADTPEQFKSSLKALRDIAVARYDGIVGKGEQENKFLSSRYPRSDFQKTPSSNTSQAAHAGGAGFVSDDGFKFPNQDSLDKYNAAKAGK